jgi:hypothetical protein
MLSVSAVRKKALSSNIANLFGLARTQARSAQAHAGNAITCGYDHLIGTVASALNGDAICAAPLLSRSNVSMSTGAVDTARTLLRHASKPLAACAATVLGLAGSSAHATTWYVYNCNESGGGSLRTAISVASSGDVINAATFVTCPPSSPISLLTAIDIPQASLRIVGDGTNTMLIKAVNPTRVFNHTGGTPGTLDNLYLLDMSISGGYLKNASGDAKGGCIYSNSTLNLAQVNVSNCEAQSTAASGKALGGAIFSNSTVNLVQSNVTDGRARSLGTGGSGIGGGVYASLQVIASHSTITGSIAYGTALGKGGGIMAKKWASVYATTVSNNQATVGSGGSGTGGGAYFTDLSSNSSFINSTISANHADTSIGGLRLASGSMTDSTISGNSAGGTIGGVSLGTPGYYLASLASTTIAFNTAGNGNAGANAAGLHLLSDATKPAVVSFSVISNNTYGATEADSSGSAIGGSSQKNLILAPMPSQVVPADTITGKCPLLYRLASNGGPVGTQTHRLGSRSPAEDAGGTTFAYSTDQRGLPRVSGPQGDLGAYEINQSDIIFDNEFDGCP